MKILTLVVATLVLTNSLAAQNVGIGTTTPSNRLHVTGSAASSFNATIYGVNTGSAGSGIFGVSNSSGTYGVQGFSTSGIGVYGNSSDYRAIYGSTATGTALYGYSSDGYGLQTVGKVKISGGNTSPTTGAVLTSIDASGNAVWKNHRVAFSARGVQNQSIGSLVAPKLEFSNESYDYGNGFTPYAGSTTESSSVFIAPVNGVYHFSCAATCNIHSLVYKIDFASLRLIVNGNLAVEADATTESHTETSSAYGSIDYQVKLNANDKVYLAFYQSNGGNLPANAKIFELGCWFSGSLVFAE